MILLESFCI